MKFNIEYYIDKLESRNNESVINLEKMFLKFIFLEAINQRLNKVTSDEPDIIYSLMQEFLDCENVGYYLTPKNEILMSKLSTRIKYLIQKISEKVVNLSEIEIKKYDLLAENFLNKINLLFTIKLTPLRNEIKANLIPILIDPKNTNFLQFFLNNLYQMHKIVTHRHPNNNSKINFITESQKKFIASFFSPEQPNEETSNNDFKTFIEDTSNTVFPTDRLLKFQLILFNLHKFFEYNFEPKLLQTIYSNIFSLVTNPEYGRKPEVFLILNYDLLRFFFRNIYKSYEYKSYDLSLIEQSFFEMFKKIPEIHSEFKEISLEKLFQLTINYGFHPYKILDNHSIEFPTFLSDININKEVSITKFYLGSLIDNFILLQTKDINENYIKIISENNPRIIKNIILHKECIKYYLKNPHETTKITEDYFFKTRLESKESIKNFKLITENLISPENITEDYYSKNPQRLTTILKNYLSGNLEDAINIMTKYHPKNSQKFANILIDQKYKTSRMNTKLKRHFFRNPQEAIDFLKSCYSENPRAIINHLKQYYSVKLQHIVDKQYVSCYTNPENATYILKDISLLYKIDLSSLDKIALLAEKFFFEIFAIKKYEKPGIFGDKYIMHQISFYLTDFETFRELVVKSYLNEAEIIEEIEKNIPIMRDNLRNAIKANDEKKVEYILSNMDAKHFDEIKLEELIYVRNTDIIDKKYLDILKNHINAPNSIIKLDDRNSEKIKEESSEISSQTDTTSLTINSKRTSEQANKIEDSNKLPTSSNSNIMLLPQKKQR